MNRKNSLRTITAFLAFASLLLVSLPVAATGGSRTWAPEFSERINSIEKKFEKRRKALGIPGMSVAIVKDGKVLLSKGYGYKDFESKVPMTPDTQLAIGSASKAFTALSVLMLQDEGKLSLDDSPSSHLPYFKINNQDTNERIQVRDLLAHSSGLNRTDLAMITGKLDREELIKVAGIAKPMAGLRERFYYQNIMFTAAGEIVARTSGMSWEDFVPKKIFAPLGMNNSTMNVKDMQRSSDYSFGYSYNFDTKKTRKLPTRDLGPVAPAGSINSSSNDMAKWLRFVLAKGVAGEKRLVSEKSFDEWTKPQMKISRNGDVSYGLGWFVQKWKDKTVIQHGGNIDGFNSMVAMIPEENLGFLMLTNVSSSSLGGEMMELVWSGMLEDQNEEKAGPEQEKETGVYSFAEAGFDITVDIKDGRFVAKVPGQPTYILKKMEGRKYALSNAPAGFFITFKDDEAFLEQPQGNYTLKKKGIAETKETKDYGAAKELIGKYESVLNPERKVEIAEVSKKISLVVEGQPPYALQKKEQDTFGLTGLPATYYLKVKRGSDGKRTGIVMVQPQGEFEFKPTAEKESSPSISTDELLAKVVMALGGEPALRSIKSRITEYEIDAVHQGVKGYGKVWSKAPGMSYSKTTLTALGKKIGWTKDYFDGEKGGEAHSFAPSEDYTGQRLADVKAGNDFRPFLDGDKKGARWELLRESKFKDEKVYLLAVHPKDGNRIIHYISAKTFLPVRSSSVIVSSTSSQRIPVSSTFEDYREIDGIMIPFKVTATNPGMGDIVTVIKKVKHNRKIKNSRFTFK